MRQANEAAFWFAVEHGPAESYEDIPTSLAWYEDLRVTPTKLIEAGSEVGYALWKTWDGGPHRMLPISRGVELCRGSKGRFSIERAFDFEYDAEGLYHSLLTDKRTRKASEQFEVLDGFPEMQDIERICNDIAQWAAEVGNPEYADAPMLPIIKLAYQASLQLPCVRAYTLMHKSQPVGFQLVWNVGMTSYTTWRPTTRDARQATRFLISEVALREKQKGASRINDGTANNRGLLWFKSEMAYANMQAYVMSVDCDPETLTP